ncbi:MAG: AAA family ATPase [Methanosarcina mazei]
MLLSEVQIENFRSIEYLSLRLNKCSILVGKNNSGKSNVLKAINMVLGEKFVKLTKNDFYNGEENRIIRIKLTFKDFTLEEIKDIQDNIKYTVKVDGIYYTPEELGCILKKENKVVMEVKFSTNNTNRNIYFGDIYYKYFSTELKDSIVGTLYIPAVRDPSKILKVTDYSFLSRMLNIIYEQADLAKKEALEETLKTATEKCREIFDEHERELDRITKTIIAHNGLKFAMLPSDSKNVYKKLDILIDDGIETELDFKGSGIQSVVIISLFKLYSDLKAGNALLLIEEPESFLHPQANRHMAKILHEFCTEDNIQLIVATHSPNYLQSSNIKDIILLDKQEYKTKATQIDKVSDETKLKRELNVSNLELFFADKVILVEGETEKILLPAIAKQINERNDFDKKNYSIIEVGSKANLDIFIELLNKFNIPWVSLLDKDVLNQESKRIITKLNQNFSYGINTSSVDEAYLINKFKENGIYIFSYGEIENYYHKEWLYKILDNLILDLNTDPETKKEIKFKMNDFVNISDKNNMYKEILSKNLDTFDKELMEKIIGAKAQLIDLDLNKKKVSETLEKIFKELRLTKPKIALKLKDYIRVDDLEKNKKDEIKSLVEYIFGAYI